MCSSVPAELPSFFLPPNIWWSSMVHPPHESDCPEHESWNAWECYFTHPLHLRRSFCQRCEKNSLTLQAIFSPLFFSVQQCKRSKLQRHLFNKQEERERPAFKNAPTGHDSCCWSLGHLFEGAEWPKGVVLLKLGCWCRAKSSGIANLSLNFLSAHILRVIISDAGSSMERFISRFRLLSVVTQ